MGMNKAILRGNHQVQLARCRLHRHNIAVQKCGTALLEACRCKKRGNLGFKTSAQTVIERNRIVCLNRKSDQPDTIQRFARTTAVQTKWRADLG